MLQKTNLKIERNSAFSEASKDFFKGKGLPGMYTYSSPNYPEDIVNGTRLFSEFIEIPEYYLRRNEESLIAENAQKILDLLKKFDTLVDLGCGNAFTNKTSHFIGAANYIPVDINKDSLNEVTKQCNNIYPKKKVDKRQLNFMTEKVQVSGTPFPVMFGCTITNFGTTDSVRQILKQVKPLMEQGNGSFVFTHDTNTNPVSLEETYTHHLIAEQTLNVLHRIKRDLNTQNFIPEAFGYHGYWDKHTSTFNLCMYPKQDMEFSINGEWINLKKDHLLPQAPLMKLPADQIITLAQAEGYGYFPPIYDQDKKIVIQHIHLQ